MGLLPFHPVWPFTRPVRVDRAKAEADRLIGLWGETAHMIALDLSAREDMGFLRTAEPGHWAAVAREIGRQIGCPEGPNFDETFRQAA